VTVSAVAARDPPNSESKAGKNTGNEFPIPATSIMMRNAIHNRPLTRLSPRSTTCSRARTTRSSLKRATRSVQQHAASEDERTEKDASERGTSEGEAYKGDASERGTSETIAGGRSDVRESQQRARRAGGATGIGRDNGVGRGADAPAGSD